MIYKIQGTAGLWKQVYFLNPVPNIPTLNIYIYYEMTTPLLVLTCAVFLVDDESRETGLTDHSRGLDNKLVGM